MSTQIRNMQPFTVTKPARRRGRGLAWLTLPCVLLATSARGEIIFPPQVKTLATTSTNFDFVAHPSSNPFVFDKYSGSMPLQSVTVAVELDLIATITIPPLISSAATSNVEYKSSSLTLDSPAGMNLDLGGPGQASLTISLVPAPETFTQTSTTTPLTEVLHVRIAPFTRTFTSAADLAQFMGAPGDTFLFPVIASASSQSMMSPANGTCTVVTQASGQISVQYTVVPEPASLALLLLGGGVTSWRGLRRPRLDLTVLSKDSSKTNLGNQRLAGETPPAVSFPGLFVEFLKG